MTNQGRLFTGPMRWAGLSLFPLLFCLCRGVIAEQATISISHQGPLLASQLRYLVDEGNDIGVNPSRAELDAQPWRPVRPAPLNLGYQERPVWVHLRIANPSARAQERLLELAHPLLDDIRIWVFDGDRQLDSSVMGDRYPFTERPILHRNFLQHLHVDGGATVDVYLRITSSSSLQLPLRLWRPEDLAGVSASHSVLTGIYYGSLLVMLLYSFSIYINGRDSKYLCYVVYLASVGLLFACANGLAFQYFWPDLPGLTNPVIIGSLGCSVLFASMFTSRFLGLANTRPNLTQALQLVSAGAFIVMLAGALLPYSWAIQLGIGLAASAALIIMVCGVARWRDGHSTAMLFTLAWLVLLLGVVLLGLARLGWLPRTALTEYTAQLGSMMEFMLFSLALIKQLNAERRAKYAAQRSALIFERQANESRQQALVLQRRATEQLETRVRQRTHELQVLNEKLRALSTTDPLTGLKNRRYFNERFLAEFSRSKRDGTPVSVIIIDVDHFKAVNDSYGHLLGDELLKVVAQHIGAQAKRESDIIARHGGEEFSVVLINNTATQAWEMADRIRKRIAMAYYQSGDSCLRCTVSIGVATMVPQKNSTPEELLKQADDALYRSKAEGRNRVSVYTQRAA